jgi:hypothetical protein
MFSGSCLTSKLYDKIIKMASKSHETNLLSSQIRPCLYSTVDTVWLGETQGHSAVVKSTG